MAKKKKTPMLPFSHRLVLNQWLIKQCGHDPLAAHKAGKRDELIEALEQKLQQTTLVDDLFVIRWNVA